MEQTSNSNLIKNTITYGTILGVVIVIYSLILLISHIIPVGFLIPGVLFIISTAIYFTGIFIFTKKIRDKSFDGSITYGQGLLIGTLIGLFAAIISSFYGYIQNAIIDPEYMNRVISAQKEWMSEFLNGKVPAEKIEESLAKIDEKIKHYNVLVASVQAVIWGTVWGFIISLVTSAFLKKKSNPIENDQTA
jgi:hypothetical protein